MYEAAVDYGSESGSISSKEKQIKQLEQAPSIIDEGILSGSIQKIETIVPEIEREIDRYIHTHESLGIKLDDKMRKEIRDKFYTRSDNPDDCRVIGSGMPISEIKRQTSVIQDKESFERNKGLTSF